jgi:cobaltochelatase CobN
MWFEGLPVGVRTEMVSSWGEAPGSVHLSPRDGEQRLVFSGIDLGGVLIAIQPPRGFGENPIAIYHSPLLPPTHHYLAFYRWLDASYGADAAVHLGKHGTLEWLPGKGVGLSAECYPDIALGDMPFVYPFVVNDPGEGAQAKRRAHAVVVDHLVPPLTRADSYDEIARLERLLDEHAAIAALDPDKLPAIRRQVWNLLVESEIHRDLGFDARFGAAGPVGGEADTFDELVLEVDGYLCELKDAQIRGGLHLLGRPPEGEALVDFVLALTRLRQGSVPSLRAAVAGALGLDLEIAGRVEVDAIEARCRELVEGLRDAGWAGPPAGSASGLPDDALRTLTWVCDWLIPALHRTTDEVEALLGALDGRHVPPGPSGAPSRGMAHVLLSRPESRPLQALDGGRRGARCASARAPRRRGGLVSAFGGDRRLGHRRDAHRRG